MEKNRKLIILKALILTFILPNSFSQEYVINLSELPELPRLSSYEQSFKDYSKTVEKNFRLIAQKKIPEIIFYKYKNTEKFTLQGLAARCNISYDTIATLNQFESATENLNDKIIIIPTVSGLFIPVEKGKSAIEILLQENHSTEDSQLIFKKDGRTLTFLPNKRFSSTERAFFLDSALQLPIPTDSYWVSSEFGKRKNPFSGQMKNHNGIDLAANEGTPVYAIKDGAVSVCIEKDREFGNYIILSHDQGKMTSVYAHLSALAVEQYDNIRKGDLLGYVGQTGMATGPHLHFEIRQNGKAEDPRLKLNLN